MSEAKKHLAYAVPPTRGDAHCVYKQVARLLEEEPQLEAVAFQPKNQLLSIATLGADRGRRIGDRVSEAVAERERAMRHSRCPRQSARNAANRRRAKSATPTWW